MLCSSQSSVVPNKTSAIRNIANYLCSWIEIDWFMVESPYLPHWLPYAHYYISFPLFLVWYGCYRLCTDCVPIVYQLFTDCLPIVYRLFTDCVHIQSVLLPFPLFLVWFGCYRLCTDCVPIVYTYKACFILSHYSSQKFRTTN